MQTFTCPHCGAILEIPLVSVDAFATCECCGKQGPLDDALRDKLVAARQALFNLPLHQRQLNAADRFAISAEQSRKRVALIWSALAVPMGLVACVYCLWVVEALQNWSDPARRPWLVFAVPLVLPFVVHIVLGLGLRKRMFRAAAEARLKFYARRNVKGGGLSCRVCSAPAKWSGLERAVIRCEYCSTDNLVEPAMLWGAAKAEVKTYDALAAHVVEIASSHVRNDRWHIAFYIVAPPFLFGGLLAGAYAADARLSAAHRPVNEQVRYVGHSCPRVDAKGKLVYQWTDLQLEGVRSYEASSGCKPPEWQQVPMSVRARTDGEGRFKAGARPIALSELVGKKVLQFLPYVASDDPAGASRVIAVASDAYGRNWLDVVDEGGKTSRIFPQGWRFFEAVRWAEYGPMDAP